MIPSFDLTGLGIGVTGAGGYLGAPIALALADAGALVVGIGRRVGPLEAVEREARSRGLRGRVVVHAADISTQEGVVSAVDRVEREAGSVYGWVNNAYSGAGGTLGHLTREEVEKSIAGGLTNIIIATDVVATRMASNGSQPGAIVNIATMYAMVSPQPALYRGNEQFHNPPAYGAAKAGLVQFTRYAACHLASSGIRVNCVSPGPFPWGKPAESESFVAALRSRVPLGRVGEAHEVAGAVLFFLSPASSFVTGQNLAVDGGWTSW